MALVSFSWRMFFIFLYFLHEVRLPRLLKTPIYSVVSNQPLILPPVSVIFDKDGQPYVLWSAEFWLLLSIVYLKSHLSTKVSIFWAFCILQFSILLGSSPTLFFFKICRKEIVRQCYLVHPLLSFSLHYTHGKYWKIEHFYVNPSILYFRMGTLDTGLLPCPFLRFW